MEEGLHQTLGPGRLLDESRVLLALGECDDIAHLLGHRLNGPNDFKGGLLVVLKILLEEFYCLGIERVQKGRPGLQLR